MYISSSSWHARVYLCWFRMKHGQHASPRQVNLCPYVRAVLFWSWSRWLMRSGKFELPLGCTVRVPWLFWGAQPLWMLWAEYAIFGRHTFVFTLQILGIICAVLSAISIFALGIYALIRVLKAEPVQDVMDSVGDGARGFGRGAASFGRVLREYYRGAHDKICPVVEFHDETTQQ